MSGSTITAPQVFEKGASAAEIGAVDFTPVLRAGELLASGPDVIEMGGTSDLTISGEAISATGLIIDGVSVPAGQAITFNFSGGLAGRQYELAATATTSTGRTPRIILRLRIAKDT